MAIRNRSRASRAGLVGLWLFLGPAAAWDPHVFIVTRDAGGGNSASMTIESPWTPTINLEPVGSDPLVRHFFGRHYVVDRAGGTIQVIDPETFDTIHSFTVDLSPQDIAVVGAHHAYVSRFDATALLEIDPMDGTVTDSIDLSHLADEDGLPEMATMALDGHRLFIQIQRIDRRSKTSKAATPAYLAVVDVRTNQLIDAVPAEPGVQPIVLAGKRPAYKMLVEPQSHRLYVSVPGGFFDGVNGSIEEIDLDLLQSRGSITDELTLQTLDLSAFTLVSPTKGFVVTHTELVESSHVTGFSRQTGAPVSQIYTTLFGSIRSIVHDPATSQVFLPDHTPDGTEGVLVFDAVTDAILTRSPIDVGGPPVDLVIARPVSPGEANEVRVDAVDAATGRLTLRYQPACEAADHTVVFGPLDQVGNYVYTGQDCGIGNLGHYDGFDPGAGSVFFLVVGNDGIDTEGSYGSASDSAERPEDLADPVCTFSRELTLRCDGSLVNDP